MDLQAVFIPPPKVVMQYKTRKGKAGGVVISLSISRQNLTHTTPSTYGVVFIIQINGFHSTNIVALQALLELALTSQAALTKFSAFTPPIGGVIRELVIQ